MILQHFLRRVLVDCLRQRAGVADGQVQAEERILDGPGFLTVLVLRRRDSSLEDVGDW